MQQKSKIYIMHKISAHEKKCSDYIISTDFINHSYGIDRGCEWNETLALMNSVNFVN